MEIKKVVMLPSEKQTKIKHQTCLHAWKKAPGKLHLGAREEGLSQVHALLTHRDAVRGNHSPISVLDLI